MALKVGELYALFTIDQTAVDTALSSIRGKLTGMSTSFTRAGIMWTNALTRPIMDFGKDSSKAAMDFESAMTKSMGKFGFTKDTEEAKEEYEEVYSSLENEVMRVAKDSIYTTDEVAGAIDKMAMAGWNWEASMAALEPIMDLAAASGEDVVTVSDIVTDAMTAMGYTWESAGGDMETFTGMVKHFSNVLATAATASNTDIGMMGQSFKYAATMAGQMGYSVDDVAVILGLMANRGVKASQAGTSLRALLTNLVNPKGDDRIDAIAAMGIDLRYDENGLLDFKSFMDQVREKFKDLHIEDVDEYIKQSSEITEKYPELVTTLDELAALGVTRQMNEKGNMTWVSDNINHSEEDLDKAKKLMVEHSDVLDDVEAYEEEMWGINKRFADSKGTPENLMQMMYANEIGGMRGMLALLAMATASAEEYDTLVGKVAESDEGEGRTHEMKTLNLDNAYGSLQMFLSSVQVLKTEIGALINESLTPMIDKAKEIVDRFIAMDDEQKKSIMDIVGLAAAMGPALIGVGLLAKLLPALGTAFSFLTTPMGLIVGLFGAMAFSALDAEGNITNGMKGIAEALGLDTSGMNFENFDLGAKLDEMMGGAVDFANSPTVTTFMTKLGEGLQSAIAKIGALDGEKLISTLIGTIKGLAESDGVKGFMKALGEGFKGAMGALGNLAGEIIAYILSPQGLSDIWNAGMSIAKLLLGGIGDVLAGTGNFIEQLIGNAVAPLIDWMTNVLREAGLIKDEVPELTLGEQTVDLGYVQFSVENEDKAKQLLAATLAAHTTEGLGGIFSAQAQRNLSSITEEASGNVLFDLDAFIRGIWGNIANNGNTGNAEGIRSAFEAKFAAIGIDISDIVDDAFYESLVDAVTLDENGRAVYNAEVFDAAIAALFDKLFAPDGTEEAAGEAAAAAAEEAKNAAINEVKEEFGLAADEAEKEAADGVSEITAAVDQGASNIGANGMAQGIANQSEPAKTAALTVSDAVVQEFLMTLSVENGYAIGTNFVNGIINAVTVTGGLLINAAGVMAASAHNAAQAAMSYASAFRIGRNFGQGLVNGINAMIGAVSDAAAAMGTAAGDSLSGAIQEGSPSKLTAKSGKNFALGFIGGINSHTNAARNAAAMMGIEAYNSLAASAREMSSAAADQVSVSSRIGRPQVRAVNDERSTAMIGRSIADAINGARVVMDSTQVGQLVTGTVSSGLANGYARRRNGTV